MGSCFSIDFVQAQNNELILEVTEECNFQYSGDNCVAELKLTNNAGKVLNGEASLHIDYLGICGDGPFDGEGIKAQFSVIDNNWLNFSGWETGTTAVSGFEIAKGETQPKLKIETVPNLCPGKYTFTLGLEGALPVVVGGGGYTPPASGTLSAEAQKVDANKDNKIDILDFNILMVNWGSTSANNTADFNGDGKVDIFDFNLLMINWTF